MTLEIIDYTGGPITEPGIYRGVPENVYHADPVPAGSFSSTQAKQILKSPAHLRHHLDSPRVEKKAFDFGHLVHGEVLGVGLEVRIIPDSVLASNGAASTAAAKEFIATARLEGAVPIKAHEWEPVQQAVEAVRAHPLAAEIFRAGEPELSLFAPDPDTGIWLRARIDWFTPGETLVDLKTARDGEPFVFEREAIRLGYDTQDAFYQYVYKLVAGGYPEGFTFVTVESAPPNLVDVHEGDLLWEQRGQRRAREAIQAYKHALDSGVWPGRPPVVNPLSIPNYLIEDDGEMVI